jgi:hypothetical protein
MWTVSQRDDKQWMIARLAELPDDDAVRDFDDAAAARYTTELTARIDEIVARAATLRMFKRGSHDTLARLLHAILAVEKLGGGYARSATNSLANSERLIEGAICDRRVAATTYATVSLAVIGAVIGILAGVLSGRQVGWMVVMVVAAGLLGRIAYVRGRRVRRKAWWTAAWALLPVDPDGLDTSNAAETLERECDGRTGAVHRLVSQRLLLPQENPGWSVIWAVYLARLAFRCGKLTDDELEGVLQIAARRLQAEYASWDELAAAVDVGWRKQARSRGADDQLDKVNDNARRLADSVWRHVPFRQP